MSTTNFELVGMPNLAGLSVGELHYSGPDSGFPISNLLNDEPSQRWRSEGILPVQTVFSFATNDIVKIDADRFGLVNHNLLSGSGYMRIVGQNHSGEYINETFATSIPTSIEDSSNTTGAVGAIDEGLSPGGDWIGPTTTGSAWSVRVRFTTVAAALSAGSMRQQFFAYVKGSNGTSARNPCYVTATLYRNGVSLGSLGQKCILSTTGQWLFWGWNANLVADGATIEVHLQFTPGSAVYASLDSVAWVYEDTNDVDTVAEVLFDTGWQPYTEPQPTGFSANRSPVSAMPRHLVLSASTASALKAIWVILRDDYAPAGLDPLTTVPINPPGYIQAGCLLVAKAWRPTRGITRGSDLVRTVDQSSGGRTRGGQTYGSRLRPYREFTFPLDSLTDSEARGLLERIVMLNGTRIPMLVRLLPDDANWSHLGTAWCELANPGAVGDALASRYPRRCSLNFTEKL